MEEVHSVSVRTELGLENRNGPRIEISTGELAAGGACLQNSLRMSTSSQCAIKISAAIFGLDRKSVV